MRFIHIIILSLILFVTGCYSTSKIKFTGFMVGTFIGKESKERIVLLHDNKYLLLAPKESLFDKQWETDTMSYGFWNIEGDLLVLNSSEGIRGQYLPINIEEAMLQNQDSITVEISNPYENELPKRIVAKNRTVYFQARPFYYAVNFETGNIGFDAKSSSIRGGNVIRYYGGQNLKINTISVTIIPDSYNYPGNYLAYKLVYTGVYETQSKGSNYFKINIPDFTINYLNYRRFKGEYMKILVSFQ